MEACYICKYSSSSRVADITIGDFWGVEKLHPVFFDRRGVSLLLINTLKGLRYFKIAEDSFEIVNSSFENGAKYNGNLLQPSSRPALRDVAYRNIKNQDVDIFKAPCYRILARSYVKEFIKLIVPTIFINLYRAMRCRID